MKSLFFKISTFILFILTSFAANAQQEIVQKAIDKITSAKNISYKETETGIDFFGNDINIQSSLSLYGYQSDNTFNSYRTESYIDQNKYQHFFDGRKKLDLDFRDSIYTLSDPQQSDRISPLHQLVSELKEAMAKSNYSVKQLADTAINKTACYHILIAQATDPSNKSYTRYHVFISTKNGVILAFTNEVKGELSKGGIVVGTVSQKINYVFTAIRVSSGNLKSPVIIDIPPGFKPEKKSVPLLSKGTIAPQWTLTSTEGKNLSLADLKGKVVLMEFTFNGCPACMLALPVLEKMHKKYDGTDVAIVSINFVDNKEAVAKFIAKNNVKSSIYVYGRPLSKVYQVSGGPTFYLINKKGEIDWSSDGYFEDFDSKVTASIEALR